jgi:nicotinamide riboside kinase
MMKSRIGICGPPSAGKTTMSHQLRRLIDDSCECAKEYARHYIEKNGAPMHVFEQMLIIDGQRKWEMQLSRIYDVVISDSPLFLSYIYGRMLTDVSDCKQKSALVRLYELALEATDEYDAIYLLPPRAIREDGVRTQDDEDAYKIYGLIEAFCDNHGIEYTHIPPGTYEDQSYLTAKHLEQYHGIKLREGIEAPAHLIDFSWLSSTE